MTLEFLHGVFQWGSVILVALAFVFVAGAIWTSNLIQDRESLRVQQMQTALASTQAALRAGGGGTASAPETRAAPAAPRTLDAAARAVLLDALRASEPDGPLEIRAVSGSTGEPGAFARVLAGVIEEAGWTLAGEGGGSTFGVPPVGLLIRVADGGEVPRRAAALLEALNRVGLGARLERVADIREGVVELMVGLRP